MKKLRYLTFVLAIALPFFMQPTQIIAADCDTVWSQIADAKQTITESYEEGNQAATAQAVETLVFWDVYAQIQCSKAGLAETPLKQLSRSPNPKKRMSPGLAAYKLWVQEAKQRTGVDIEPAGLVRGQTFNKDYGNDEFLE